jgi:hemoglobin
LAASAGRDRHSEEVTTRREYRDIETRDDCERLVRAFYGRALEDPIIGWIFTDVAELDLEAHVPRLTAFWETVLLGAQTYSGGSFHPHAAVHAKAELKAGHFERWLALWYQTLDELFAGPRAEGAKVHAFRLGNAFRMRLASYPSPADEQREGVVVTRHRRDR